MTLHSCLFVAVDPHLSTATLPRIGGGLMLFCAALAAGAYFLGQGSKNKAGSGAVAAVAAVTAVAAVARAPTWVCVGKIWGETVENHPNPMHSGLAGCHRLFGLNGSG